MPMEPSVAPLRGHTAKWTSARQSRRALRPCCGFKSWPPATKRLRRRSWTRAGWSRLTANLQSKGLIGDVFLRSRPSGTHISDVFVQTSTRRKELKLDIEVSDLTAAGPVQFTAKLLDAKGMEERRFQGNARMNGNGRQVVQLAWRWDNPRLWDLQQPNLYTLKLEAKGTDWHDEYAQPFGFREFWIDGRKFFLNGTEIRLRPTSHGYMETCFGGSIELTDAHIDGCMYAGFNIEECWPTNHDEKGSVNHRALWADRADRKGFLLIGTALPIDPGQWTKPGYQRRPRKEAGEGIASLPQPSLHCDLDDESQLARQRARPGSAVYRAERDRSHRPTRWKTGKRWPPRGRWPPSRSSIPPARCSTTPGPTTATSITSTAT